MSLSRFAAVAAVALLAAAPAAAQNDPCRDPWVSKAVREVKGRAPIGKGEAGECNIKMYGASWSSYDDLKGKVQQTFKALDLAMVEFRDNGRFLYDRKYFGATFFLGNQGENLRVGPRGSYSGVNWHIDLPNVYQLVMTRKCPQKLAPNTVCG